MKRILAFLLILPAVLSALSLSTGSTAIPTSDGGGEVSVYDPFGEGIAASAEAISLDAVSALLMEANTGTVLYEVNADAPLPPASVTKIMTLLLVMEALEKGTVKWDDMVTVSAHAASMGGSQVFLKEGETT